MRSLVGRGAGEAGGAHRLVRVLVLALVPAVLATGACQPGSPGSGLVPGVPSGADYVLAPEDMHYGATYAQWSQRWWQWVWELPRTQHPLYDETGADALRGQLEPVYFLGGVFTVLGNPVRTTVVRDITIPSGVALFFPIINFSWDNTNCTLPDTEFTFTQMRAWNAERMREIRDVLCEIDGVRVLDAPDLEGAQRFRAQAPAFSTWLTADNIYFDFCGGVPLPAREVSPVASDGIYMMIAPMPSGGHTVHFKATSPGPGEITMDVTYHITVLP